MSASSSSISRQFTTPLTRGGTRWVVGCQEKTERPKYWQLTNSCVESGRTLDRTVNTPSHWQVILSGSHFANYDSFLILSHFKGPAINGFGGAFKNMSTKWGSSAGARMAGNIALSRSVSFGQDDLPKPSVVIMAYTGQSSYSWLRPGAGHLTMVHATAARDHLAEVYAH